MRELTGPILAGTGAALISALALALPGAETAKAQGAACALANSPPAPLPGHISAADSEKALKCLINQERGERGLNKLKLKTQLRAAARKWSAKMDNGDFFAHGNFVKRIRKTGYMHGTTAWALGENLGWGPEITPRGIFNNWMDSDTHRTTMLKPKFKHIGVGVAWGAPKLGEPESGAATYTADFGWRKY